mmetsp:Transcript_15391/g.42586  ORF Transcript_15391/g.42586 Transcript_15391/m.42586 type:complete len:131 (-) Transcript_15391:11-403(-)
MEEEDRHTPSSWAKVRLPCCQKSIWVNGKSQQPHPFHPLSSKCRAARRRQTRMYWQSGEEKSVATAFASDEPQEEDKTGNRAREGVFLGAKRVTKRLFLWLTLILHKGRDHPPHRALSTDQKCTTESATL